MEQVVRLAGGFVRIRLISHTPERFLKLCANHGISFRHLVYHNGSYEMEISVRDFRRLQQVCRKSSSHVHILEKTGLPFFFYRNKKRKAFFIGIFCCLMLLLFCSRRIWNIHVEGNCSYSTQNILEYLEQEDIIHGIAKRKLNCSEIAASLREHFPDITWVSARIQGTRLLITVQENTNPDQEIETPSEGGYDLEANREGTIVHMVTRAGVPVKKVGEICKEGEILVSGCLEILNDSKEVVRYEYVSADADVFIQRQVAYRDTFPLRYKKRFYTGRKHKKVCVQIFSYQMTLGLPQKKFEHYDQVSNLENVRLTENYILPFAGGLVVDREYEIRDFTYSKEEAKALAEEHFLNFLEELSEKGMKISWNDVKIFLNDSNCISSGNVTVVEKIGKRVPIQMQEELQERTQVDEQ